MRKQDVSFDYRRYRQLLADAVDEDKRMALINILIEERARDRLAAQVASDRAAVTASTIAKVLRSRGAETREDSAVNGRTAWRYDLINDPRKSRIKLFVLGMLPQGPRAGRQGGNMKTISSIARDRAFKSIVMLSFFGLAVSFCMMAFGMDLSVLAL